MQVRAVLERLIQINIDEEEGEQFRSAQSGQGFSDVIFARYTAELSILREAIWELDHNHGGIPPIYNVTLPNRDFVYPATVIDEFGDELDSRIESALASINQPRPAPRLPPGPLDLQSQYNQIVQIAGLLSQGQNLSLADRAALERQLSLLQTQVGAINGRQPNVYPPAAASVRQPSQTAQSSSQQGTIVSSPLPIGRQLVFGGLSPMPTVPTFKGTYHFLQDGEGTSESYYSLYGVPGASAGAPNSYNSMLNAMIALAPRRLDLSKTLI